MNKSTAFNERCYELLKQIPEGKVTTYKELARALGTNAWRSVGTAMGKNRDLIVVPCHRVIRSDGHIGEYALGSDKKVELLRNEGVEIDNKKVKAIDKYFYRFDTQQY